MTAQPPTGNVTFLFTDIVGSTELWERHGDSFLPVLQAHNAILTTAIEMHGGYIMKTEGDAYKVAFDDPVSAVRCAILAQAYLQRFPWPEDVGPLSVRIAIHCGRPFLQAGDYFGPPLNRTARILSTVHGGQIVLSEDVMNLVGGEIDASTEFVDLGHHRLRDLDQPIRLYQATHSVMREQEFPPPRSLNPHPHNLPVQRTSFIGREKEIEQIAARLAQDDTPLLLITGPEGIGKTRLSLQVAAEQADLFPDGVWYIVLNNAKDVSEAAAEIAKTIGIAIPPASSPVRVVREWLAKRRCLLILDDVNRFPEASRFIRELLSEAPSLRCLAASRESLNLQEGEEIALQGLSLPEQADVRGVLSSESGQLFLDRVKQIRDDFELTEQRAPAISRLLKRLKGVPGMIENAAETLKAQQSKPAQLIGTLGKEVTQIAEGLGKELVSRMKEAPSLSALFSTLSILSANQGELAEAERECLHALERYQHADHKPGIAQTLWHLGRIAYAQRDYRRSVSLLSASLQAYTEMQSHESQQVASDLEFAQNTLQSHEQSSDLTMEKTDRPKNG
jgi:class 3 adenylate cyclase/tetratricopeptide (TPR) repeat protein